MEHSNESLADAIKEELVRLGVTAYNLDVQLENKKPSLYQSGTKFLGFTNNNQARERGKNKIGNFDSPNTNDKCQDPTKSILLHSLSVPQSGIKTPSKFDIKTRRNAPKSPFSSKNRHERKSGRKKNGLHNGIVSKNNKEMMKPTCTGFEVPVEVPEGNTKPSVDSRRDLSSPVSLEKKRRTERRKVKASRQGMTREEVQESIMSTLKAAGLVYTEEGQYDQELDYDGPSTSQGQEWAEPEEVEWEEDEGELYEDETELGQQTHSLAYNDWGDNSEAEDSNVESDHSIKNKNNFLTLLYTTTDLVFGCELASIPLCSAQLKDGALVNVPECIIDISNFIRRNISVEGIFRKAGSSQRQNDVKKLINCGINLPSTIHPIDAACLLKQFLRSLPTSLLAPPVHSMMISCLEVKNIENQQKALSLCIMLLPKTHQHLLLYILELLFDVASARNMNMMDARNLGIVLAPNLLPAFNNNGPPSKKNAWFNDDHLLTSTINVLECLIDGANVLCKLSNNIAEAIQNRERSKSLENLTDASTSCGSQKKKRRSASIHRLMNGIRRVVQGGGSLLNSQPTLSVPSPKTALTPIRLADKGSTVNMHPDADQSSPGSAKRKSDANESPPDQTIGNLSTSQQQDFDRPKKKPRLDLASSIWWASSHTSQESVDKKEQNQLGIFKTKHPKAIQSLVTVREDPQESVKRSFSLRERRNETNSPVRKGIKSRNQVKRRKSCEIVSTPLKVIQNRALLSYTTSVSPATPSLSPLINHPNSSILLPLRPSTPLRLKDCRLKYLSGQFLPYCPVGSDITSLGHRGIPDGSECNIRESAMSKSSDPIYSLEKQYDKIKCAVRTIEEEIDRDNIRQVKKEFLFNKDGYNKSDITYSEIIHDAYERMKNETKDLDCSPSDYLSKRLGKELKIRSRRSDEHRVMRSPSERKIGSIRRRSKELEQNALKNLGSNINSYLAVKPSTPKLKGSLLHQSPHSTLKRGKPNSLRSGLPLVVKPANTVGLPGVSDSTPSRGICIAKRPSSRKSPKVDNETFYSSFSSTHNDQRSSYLSLNESILGSLADDYTGPMTRRRSSVLSTTSNPLPILNLNSAENSLNMSSKSFSCLEINNENNSGFSPEFLKKEAAKLNETFVKDAPSFPNASENDASSEEALEWIPATTYMNSIQDEPNPNPAQKCEPGGNRPSIAALMKQKKVTANVQLFNQLHVPNGMITPTSMRRSSRYKRIGNNHAPLRCIASERRCSRPRLPSERSRLTLTPLDVRPSRSRQVKLSVEATSSGMNLTSESATPRIMGRAAPGHNYQSRCVDNNNLFSGLTPLPPRPYKPSTNLSTPKINAAHIETPPRLPPRLPTNSTNKSVSRTNVHSNKS